MGRRSITQAQFENFFTLAENLENSKPLIFERNIFDFEIIIEPFHRELIFEDCEFKHNVIFKRGVPLVRVSNEENQSDDINLFTESIEFNEDITFKGKCEFKSKLILADIKINGKFRLHNCSVECINFTNTRFNDLADFWKTTFKTKTTFYKTDFNATVVFSMATFNENVLFTYSLLAGKAIFTRTKFKKGLDLSQAIISGNVNFFDLKIKHSSFKAKYFHDDEESYQAAIDHEGIIPLVNKQETFRLLKHYSISNGNTITASRYKVFEYKSYNTLIWKQMRRRHRWISNFANIPMMFFNRITNNYGSNFWLSALFTFCIAVIFLNCMLAASGSYEYTWEYTAWEWDKLTTLLNPLHKIKDLELDLNKKVYILDFLSRIAIGYGIYQTIQAFRKFK